MVLLGWRWRALAAAVWVWTYGWLLKVAWQQSHQLVLLSQHNNQLRIQLFTATAMLAKDEDVRQHAELSETQVHHSRVIDFLSEVVVERRRQQQTLAPTIVTTTTTTTTTVTTPPPSLDPQVTTLSKTLDLIKAELTSCQSLTDKLRVELALEMKRKPAACTTTTTTSKQRIKIDEEEDNVNWLDRDMALGLGFSDEDDDRGRRRQPATTTTTRQQQQRCVATFEFDKKRSGSSYSSRTASSANRCKKLCMADEDCQAWVFTHDESECAMYLRPGIGQPDKCCVSGVRCAG